MKRFTTALAVMLAMLIALSGCSQESGTASPSAASASPQDVGSSTAQSPTVSMPEVSEEDINPTWNPETSTDINGAESDSGIVTITEAGEYNITGKLTGVVVAATNKDTVRLILNGAAIVNPAGAAIYASQCDKLIITLADGTENTVTDGGANYKYVLEADEEPNAAIFCKDDLTINGTGSLTVNAGFHNGIGTKDDLVVSGGIFNIEAANNGIRGNDSVTIIDGSFTIKAGNDGIQSSNATDAGKGFIAIEGGTFDITAAHDGIQAETTLGISGGTFDITSGGGGNASSDSYKGLKATGNIEFSSGTFNITSADDSIHSNADIIIRGGGFTLATEDDGIHADNALNVSGGTINVTKAYEGLEATTINITGGTITVISTDDGINAAGGIGAVVGGGLFGNDRFAGGSGAGISISGGVITLYTTSDGIDSNGTLDVSGGTLAILIGTTRDGDATDTDSGGTIQPALYGSGNISAGTTLAVEDLWSITLASNVTSYCLILPGVVNGQSYQLTANGQTLAAVTATTTIQGMMGGGNAGGMGGMGGGRPRR